jgi:hypothetical protein
VSFTFRLCQPCNSLHIAYCTGEGVGPNAGLNVLAKGNIVLAKNLVLHSFFESFYFRCFLPSFFLPYFVYLSFLFFLSLILCWFIFPSFFLSFFFILSVPHSLLLYFCLPSCLSSLFWFFLTSSFFVPLFVLSSLLPYYFTY